MPVTVSVIGMPNVVRMLTPEAYEQRAWSGLTDAGHAVERAAKSNLHDHHFRGRAETQTTTSAVSHEGHMASVTVGIHGGLAPEGRPLEFGWKSSGGRMPPIQPIAEWILAAHPSMAVGTGAVKIGMSRRKGMFGPVVSRKGTVASATANKGVRSIAFLIARKIGQRGYSFGALHWLGRGYDSVRPRVAGYIEKAVRRV